MNFYDILVCAVLAALGVYIFINFKRLKEEEKTSTENNTESEPELMVDEGGSIEIIDEPIEEIKKEVKAKTKKPSKKASKKVSKKAKRNPKREL